MRNSIRHIVLLLSLSFVVQNVTIAKHTPRNFDREKIEKYRDKSRFDYTGPEYENEKSAHSTETLEDGTIIEEYLDGTIIERYGDGTVIEKRTDGIVTTRKPDGTVIRQKDDLIIERYPDGRVIRREGDGVVYERSESGKIIEKRTDGTVREIRPGDNIISDRDFKDLQPRSIPEPDINLPQFNPPQSLMNILLMVVIVIVVGLIVFFLMRVFGNSNLEEDGEPLTEDELSDNIHEMDFDTMIQQLVAQKKYRRVVRLLYLKSLKIMTDKDLIQWEVNKTNWDYVFELKSEALRPGFKDLTIAFEYVWYGHVPVSDEQFSHLQNQFTRFNKKTS